MTGESPISDIPLEPFPEGWTPTGVVALIKCTDADGADAWAFRASEHLSDEEILGVVTIRAELTKAAIVSDHSEP